MSLGCVGQALVVRVLELQDMSKIDLGTASAFCTSRCSTKAVGWGGGLS